MDEIMQVYTEELYEKAHIARNGNKYATKPEPRTKVPEAPVAEVNVYKLVPFEEFKRLPDTLKKEWFERHTEHWNVGPTAVAEAMGVNLRTLANYTRKLGIKMKTRHKDAKAITLYQQAMKPQREAAQEEPKQMQQETTAAPALKVQRQAIELQGEFNAQAIAAALQAVWAPGKPVKIQITIEEA